MKRAIYLPRGKTGVPDELLDDLRSREIFTPISMLTEAGIQVTPSQLRAKFPEMLSPYSDEQISEGLRILSSSEKGNGDTRVTEDDTETAFRRAEYEVLRDARDEKQLLIRTTNLSNYEDIIARYFSRVLLVNKLRETRALAGFSRIIPENNDELERRKVMLRRHELPTSQSWLPAYIVYGEGIFLEFNEAALRDWESRAAVVSRASTLNKKHQQRGPKGVSATISPRLLLLHTLAHLLMNRLIFECGYGSASLCERLYVSDSIAAPMAGILLYTAAGDAEGTMGGLVRMGKPAHLEPMLRRALEGALWCSADPVCMEMASRGGQGPDSCNLAACHSCALVPETACELFNRFLDRGMVVGDLSSREIGYFV